MHLFRHKLNMDGVQHVIIPLLAVMLLVAAGGTYFMVKGHAAPAPAAAPAIATTVTGSMCTFSGNHYCVNSANFSHGTLLTTGGGARTIKFTGPGIGATGKLQLTGGSDACITSWGSSYELHIESCSSTGVEWYFADTGNGTRGFRNIHNSNRWIAAQDQARNAVLARPQPYPGYLFKWRPLN